MEASPQARYLGHWVKVINHDVTVKISRLLKPFGLTRSSWSVLYQVNAIDDLFAVPTTLNLTWLGPSFSVCVWV